MTDKPDGRADMLRILGKSKLDQCAQGACGLARNWTAFRPRGLERLKVDRQPEFLALNPNAMVPVLVDGDQVLWESNTICRYLAGPLRRRGALLPADPAARARVEQWMDWQATELTMLGAMPSWPWCATAPPIRTRPRSGTASRSGTARWASSKRQLGKTGAYAAGAEFSLADIVLGLSANRWMMTPIERPDYPAIARLRRALAAAPGIACQF